MMEAGLEMVSMLGEVGRKSNLEFEETELRLGLPGGGGREEDVINANGKRSFSETMDLKLNLASKEAGRDINKNSENKPVKPPANLSGGLERQKMKYLSFLHKRINTERSPGPIYFRTPSKFLWLTIRGRLGGLKILFKDSNLA